MTSSFLRIKFALIGCGHIAPRWLDALQNDPNVDLIAVADPNPQSFDKLSKYKFPNLKTYSTIEQTYNNHQIDAVVIATPPQYHARYIIDAVRRGIHVLAEKPLCVSIDQFRHVIQAQRLAEEKGIITAVNQQYRWNPRVEAIFQAVQSGKLGRVFLVNSEFSQNNYHFKKWWRQQNLYISAFNWYVHIIDSMRYYLNSKPQMVWAKFIRPPHSKILGYSSLFLNVTFENGTEWHLTANQEAVAGPTTSGHTRFVMYGEKGTLVNTKNESPVFYSIEGEKEELGENIGDVDNQWTYPPGWPDSVAKFVHAIRTGTEHPTSIRDNFWTMVILLAAIVSFENQQSINVNDFLHKYNIDNEIGDI
ncbi:Gfo/Idh/MocA family protein [Candidatus Harpocratesius sp.]